MYTRTFNFSVIATNGELKHRFIAFRQLFALSLPDHGTCEGVTQRDYSAAHAHVIPLANRRQQPHADS